MKNILLLKLIERFRSGDMEAFSEIYNEFKNLIRIYSIRTETEDALQEFTVFLVELLYEVELDNFPYDFSNSLKRYIAVSIRNKYIALSKNEQNYRSLITGFYENCGGYTETEYDFMLTKDLISQLPPKYALVIVYRYIYGYSDEEIAQFLGKTRQSVFRLRQSALKKMRENYI